MSEDKPKSIREEVAERLAQEEALSQAPEPPDIPLEDVVKCMWMGEKGDGELFARLLHGRLANAPELKGQWLKFNGVIWQDIPINGVEKEVELVAQRYDLARRHYQEQLKEADDKEAKQHLGSLVRGLTAAVARNRSRKGISNTYHLSLTADWPMIIELSQFDSNPMLLACANGVIDLTSGEHRPARPEDYLRRTCKGPKGEPVEWLGMEPPFAERDKEAFPPHLNQKEAWHAFVRQVAGDSDEVTAYMQRLMGYAITGKSNEAVFSVFTGAGRNGKSQLIKILREVLGDYMAPIQAEMLLDQGYNRNADSPSPSITGLRGVRVAFASETDENRRFSTSKVKWLTGGDPLVGRYAWDRDNISFNPTHTLFLLTNHKPRVKAHEQAFFDRLQIVNFPYRFVDNPSDKLPMEKQRDPGLEEKLLAIKPGILAWLVEGCLLYQREGLNPPEVVLQATYEYRREQDQMRDFVEDCLHHQPGERTSAKDLYHLYLGWHEANRGGKPPTQTSFGSQIKHHLNKKEKVSGLYYYFDYIINPEATARFALE